MRRHSEIWGAIDRLAELRGLSTSGLARRSGLDPTTFNKSKRTTREGKLRWPSTESISKILDSTRTDLAEFVSLFSGSEEQVRYRDFPLIGLAEAGAAGYFDDAGYPSGTGWDEITFPDVNDPNAYALEISGESMEPVYRDGDIVIVSPAAGVRRGDRVVVKTLDGEILAKQMVRKSTRRCDLKSLNPEFRDRVLSAETIEWIARIVWVSQ